MNRGLKWNLRTLWMFILAFAVAGCFRAQDITGNWQGTITPPHGKPLRMILRVTHDDSGAFKARIYSIDQDFTGDWADSFTVQDSTVKFVVGMIGLSYEGRLSSDGDTISGTWIQGGQNSFYLPKGHPVDDVAPARRPLTAHRAARHRRAGSQARSPRLGWHWPSSRLPRRSGRHRARVRPVRA